MTKTEVKINSFDPLNLELPSEAITGNVRLTLPDIKIKLIDLSMGGIIPDGPHVGTEGQVLGLDFDLADSEMALHEMVEFIQAALPQLRKMHELVQGHFGERFLLGKD